ncbi:MAG: Oligopeptide transport system permease protein OppC [Chloroflexi bacterium ADurb.Bin325]|nr:MAG: Oligopeptide transport system permease protein OppC [Chloroflexi bacterium ADurb.Bin325]
MQDTDMLLPSDDTAAEPASVQTIMAETEPHEGYFQLVWRRFKRSKASIFGGLLVLALAIMALFAEFFSPYPLEGVNLTDTFIAPSIVRLIDANGRFHLRPFVYAQDVTLDPKTFAPTWTENTDVMYPIQFFVKGFEYKLLGLIPWDRHLFGVESPGSIHLMGTDKFGRDLFGKSCQAGRISLTMALFGTIISVAIGSVLGVTSGYYGGKIDNAIQRFVEFVNCFPQLPLWMSLAAIVPRTWDSFKIFVIMAVIFAMLSWTTLEREVRGKVLAFRSTDFVLAAKEMGASDRRIIFLHLYPNSLSHVLVILTLTVPSIILAEAFLSFLGIGIQEPLISWGLLMRNAQNIQTLGQYPWMMTPVFFIITAVLGFNFLGDGLRDAADPYAAM